MSTKKDLQTILTIDDDDDIRMIGSMILKKKGGFEVTTKRSGEAGIEYLRTLEEQELPDLILLDVMMPGMDGPQTLQKIQNEEGPISSIPVVFLTAKCQPDEVVRLIELGAKEVIPKPFNSNTLADQVLEAWNSFAS